MKVEGEMFRHRNMTKIVRGATTPAVNALRSPTKTGRQVPYPVPCGLRADRESEE